MPFINWGAIGGRRVWWATTHKTVRRAVERQQAGGPWVRRPRPISKNTDKITALISDRVRASDGRISAKRLLPSARAAGYQGSARGPAGYGGDHRESFPP
jgi:hypothetical protein